MQYTGQIVDGLMHGKGKLTYESGESYEGDWVKGKVITNHDIKYNGGHSDM